MKLPLLIRKSISDYRNILRSCKSAALQIVLLSRIRC